MRLRLVGLPSYRGTHPGLTERWERGAVRDVGPDEAAYLLERFAGVFEAAGDVGAGDSDRAGVVAAMGGPPVDRAARAARRR